MKTPKKKPKQWYLRLLSYDNACKVIDFINKNDKNDYANITTGGVSMQVSDGNWEKVLAFILSLNVRYEVGSVHPHEVEAGIIASLSDAGVIQDKSSTRIADHYADEYGQDKQQSKETDQEYRNRIAYYLRDHKNKIKEGQDVLNNIFVKYDKYGSYYADGVPRTQAEKEHFYRDEKRRNDKY